MRRFKEDKAEAVAVLGMMLIVFIMIVGGGVFDFTKGFQLKKSYTNAAQHATHSAIMHQHPKSGALKVHEASAQAIVSYENLANSGAVKRGNALAKCDNSPRMVRILFATNRDAAKKYKYNTPKGRLPKGVYEVVKYDLNKVPLNSMNFDAALTQVKAGIRSQTGNYNNIKADTIILEVHETTPNTMLSTGYVGMGKGNEIKEIRCQRIGVASTATTYFENE